MGELRLGRDEVGHSIATGSPADAKVNLRCGAGEAVGHHQLLSCSGSVKASKTAPARP